MKIFNCYAIYFLSIIYINIGVSIDVNLLYSLKEYFKSDVMLFILSENKAASAEEIFRHKQIAQNTLVGFTNADKNFTEFFQRTSHLQNPMIICNNKINLLKNIIIKQNYNLTNFWASKIFVNFIREDIKDELVDIEIPLNSKFLLVNSSSFKIMDVYQIGKNTPKIYSHFANWNQSALKTRAGNFYIPRMNLNGHELKIFIPRDKNFSRPWHLLSEAMNFNISWFVNTGGALYSNGTKVGWFKEIYERDMDGTPSNLVYNSLRLDDFDYIFPAHVSHTKMYVAKLHKLNWTSIIAPFDEEVWICIVLWTILAALVLFLVQKYQRGDAKRFKHSSESSLFVILKAFCYQGGKINGSSISIYISHLMPFLLGVVLIQYYSAVLLSYLTVQRSFTPFRNLQEVIKDGSYKIIVQNATYASFYFSTDLGEEAKMIRNGLLTLVPNEKAEFPYLCEKRQIVACGTLGTTIKVNCDIAEIPDPIFYETAGILVWKGFPYRDIMIKLLKRLQFSGLLKLKEKNYIIPYENFKDPKPLSLEIVLPIFLLYINLMLLVLVLTLLEIVIWRKNYQV